MKKAVILKIKINPNIKVGNYVQLFDGSALSCDKHDDSDTPLHIVNTYPELTGMSLTLKEIPALVISTDIKDRICNTGDNNIYLQDIVVKIGDSDFRTCSAFVEKI